MTEGETVASRRSWRASRRRRARRSARRRRRAGRGRPLRAPAAAGAPPKSEATSPRRAAASPVRRAPATARAAQPTATRSRIAFAPSRRRSCARSPRSTASRSPRMQGSGIAGRVTQDGHPGVHRRRAPPAPAPRARPSMHAPVGRRAARAMPEPWPGDTVEPMSKIRALTSDHMVASRAHQCARHVVLRDRPHARRAHPAEAARGVRGADRPEAHLPAVHHQGGRRHASSSSRC